MEIKRRINNMGLRVVVVFFVVGIYLLPMASAQDPPVQSSSENEKECLFYAFTTSENHNFLITNNTSVFGTNVSLIHNCNNVELRVDGIFYASSNNSFDVKIEPGIHNITIISEQKTSYFSNVVFYPDVLLWESEYQYLINPPIQKEYIDLDLAESQQNWSVALGILMVWVLSTYVYWKLIQSYTDKNFIEEVVS